MAGTAWTNQPIIAALVIIEAVLNGGLFVYAPEIAEGDLIASVTAAAGDDAEGNAYLPGIVSYANLGAGGLEAAQLGSAALTFWEAAAAGGPWSQVAQAAQFAYGVAVTPGLQIGVQPVRFLAPTGDTAGTDDWAQVHNSVAAGFPVVLLPGQWYFNQGVTIPAGGAVYATAGAVINDVSPFTGTAIFYPDGDNITLAGFTAVLNYAALTDFQNTNIDYFTMADVNATAGTLPLVTTPPDLITNLNLHRSLFDNCVLTQNNPAASILTLGSSGSGLSTTTFRACKFTATCYPGSATDPGSRTVPAINLQVPGNKNLDVLKFADCWFNNAKNGTNLDNGEYFISVACTEGGANHDEDRLYFENCSANQVIGGFIECQSVVGVSMTRVSVGNVFSVTTPSGTKATASSFLNFGTFAGGQHCQAVTIADYEREGTADLTSGSNPSDMQFSSDVVDVLVTAPHVPDSGGAIQVDSGGCADFNLIAANTNLVWVTQPGTGTQLGKNGLTVFGASGQAGYGINGGAPQLSYDSGFQQNASGSLTSSTDVSSIATTSLTAMGHRQIPAGDVTAGARYTGYLSGFFTTGTTPSSATFSVYWGGTGGDLLASLAAATIPAALTNAAWSMDIDVVWTSATTAETRIVLWWHSGSGVSGSVAYFTVNAVTGLTTTSAENLTAAFQWGSVPGSTELLVDACLIGRTA